MATFTFEAHLQADGSLSIPKEAFAELDLHPGDEVHVQIEATKENNRVPETTVLERAVYAMTHRTPAQIAAAQAHAMEAYQPVRTVPPGKTLADMVSGKWPGDETDEQILAALKELS
jgi:antitoxin component of MazEF toxin-antitoxin module